MILGLETRWAFSTAPEPTRCLNSRTSGIQWHMLQMIRIHYAHAVVLKLCDVVSAAYGSKVGPRLNPEDGSVSPHSSSAHTSPTTRNRQRIRSADADNKKLVRFLSSSVLMSMSLRVFASYDVQYACHGMKLAIRLKLLICIVCAPA